MRGLRAVIPCLLTAFALPSCMQSPGARPRSNINAMAVPIAAAGRFSPGDTIRVGKSWS
jgi:uncharacterized membrane protein